MERSLTDIKYNYDFINEKIAEAAMKAGKTREDITFLSATKTVEPEYINYAISLGLSYIGENKVQELVEKYEVMPRDIRWHMIGHLQRNKVKYIVDKVALIHGVDSLKLAEEISKEAQKKGVEVSILIEVNMAREESKFGVSPEEAPKLISQIAALPAVHIKGLMTIAPYTENAEENRQFFMLLRQLAVDISRKNIDNVSMNVLSMGMTGDYIVAVEEGATYVRVGTGIFGERQYL